MRLIEFGSALELKGGKHGERTGRYPVNCPERRLRHGESRPGHGEVGPRWGERSRRGRGKRRGKPCNQGGEHRWSAQAEESCEPLTRSDKGQVEQVGNDEKARGKEV